MTKPKERFRALNGLDYATAKGPVRVEPGEEAIDVPAKSAKWLLEQGHIEPWEAEAERAAAAAAAEGGDA